jgi:Acetyltransferase (GNAT) domain
MELRGDRVLLRPLRVEDTHRIADLAADPEVARWWPDLTEAKVVEKAEGREDSTGFAVLLDGELIGLVQYYEELDPEYATRASTSSLARRTKIEAWARTPSARSHATSFTTAATTV